MARDVGVVSRETLLAGSGLAAMAPVRAGAGLEPQADAVHQLSEAGRLAFADRALYAAKHAGRGQAVMQE